MKRILKILSKMLPLFYTLLILVPFGCSLFIDDGKISSNKICFLVIVGIIALVTYLISEEDISMEREQNKLSIDILKGERDVAKYKCDAVLIVFEGVIKRNETHQKLNYDPYKVIEFVLKSINLCFETYLDLRSKYVSATVFYHFDFQKKNEWKRFDKNYCKAYRSNKKVIFEKILLADM